MRIAVAQMNTRDDKEANLRTAGELIEYSAGQGARLVILPENFNYLGPITDPQEIFEDVQGPTVDFIRSRAREHGVYIHLGSFRERCPGEERRSYNTSVVVDPGGEIIATYRKIHLFDIDVPGKVQARESDTMVQGEDIVTVKVDDILLGLTICYDMRFPELFRQLMLKGAELVAVPAAFTLYTGKDHWEPILRTRAVENTFYVAAPAQIGAHPPDRRCFGSSMIIDPWGTVVARAPERVTAVLWDIDLGHLQEVRQNLPCLEHRVPDLYGFKGE